MDDLLDMIATEDSPSTISDKIKDLLFAKAAERVEYARPYVSSSLFGFDGEEEEVEEEE